jgi:ActD protein
LNKTRAFLVATFSEEGALLRAVRALRGAGFRIWDVYTPYPVHGLDVAMGLRPSRLPRITLAAAVVGALGALGLQVWASAIDWPLNVGGKPDASWLAFVPITFETAVLAAGTATFGALLLRCRLLPGLAPRLVPDGVTEDRFAIAIRRRDGGFDAGMARRLLEENGAQVVGERLLGHEG